MATFTGKVRGGSLNMRQTCSTSATRLTSIPDGTTLTVQTVSGQNDWFQTSYSGKTGYVVAQYIAVTTGVNTCTVTTQSDPLNIRKTPSTSASAIYTAAKGSILYLLDSTSVTGWFRVSSSSGTGWASKSFLTINSTGGGSDIGSYPITATVDTAKHGNGGTLNLRQNATTGSTLVTKIPNGATIHVNSLSGEWLAAKYNTYTGYVMAMFIVGTAAYNASTSGGGTTPSTGNYYKATVSKTGVNIRKEAALTADAWGQIDKNRRIIVQDIGNSNWYRTFWGNNPGKEAYIKADCVSLGVTCNNKKDRVLYLVGDDILVGKYKWYFGGDLAKKTGGLINAWCQSFCNWVLTSAGLSESDAPLSESNAKSAKDDFASSTTKYTFITSDPREGDVIYYKWKDSINVVDHAGLIYKVEGQTIYSYEGNRGKNSDEQAKVSKWSTLINDSQIVGYGRPVY